MSQIETDEPQYPKSLTDLYNFEHAKPLKFLLHREITAIDRSIERSKLQVHHLQSFVQNIKQGISLPGLKKIDKIFASHWLSEDSLLIGTKDNQLIYWHIASGKVFPIHLPGTPTTTSNCGIHFISQNEHGSLLATGAQNPNHVALFHLPSLTPLAILEGQQDWVFAGEFIENNVFVTAGRDCFVNLFHLDETFIQQPTFKRKEHDQKVRDLKQNKFDKKFATVGADNFVKVWDAQNFGVTTSIFLPNANELVCMAYDTNDVIAVGSQYKVHLIDPRVGDVISEIDSKDSDWGVRSVAISDHILSVGGGMGHLSFFDLRKGKYLKLENNYEFVATKEGWLDKNTTFYLHCNGMDIPNAIYTHTFSPSKTKLFIGGGPLQLGLKGAYGAIWV